MPKPHWLYADFNGLLGADLLCLAHRSQVKNYAGQDITLATGMAVTAYDDDADEQDHPDAIFASGVVEPSPELAQCRGSRWALRIDAAGIRHESDIVAGSDD